MKRQVIAQGIPFLIGILFVILIAIALAVTWYRTPLDITDQMVQDIHQLKKIVEQIDHDALIIDFDYQQNWINFLHIKKGGFVGSEVGSANLAYPDKWNGPYLDENPTLQEKEYMVVRTNQGYFITPGDGVTLPNGKIIGKDIMLDENADIAAMMHDKETLMYADKSLAVPLLIGDQARRVQASELLPPD